MTATTGPQIGQIKALLAERGYEISDPEPNVLVIRDPDSTVAIRAVLEGDILYFALTCTIVREDAVTPQAMARMLAGDNGISTSYFQIYDAGNGNVAVTLNNFCKLQDLGADDQDDILSCVHFLLADVISAKRLLGDLKA